MKRRASLSILFFYFISSLMAQGGKLFTATTGNINFRSEAPFELIKASSKELVGLLDVDKKIFAFKVSIKTFQGFNSALQREHFNENYMESNQFPEATFGGKIIEDIDFTKEGDYSVRAKGNLMVHGINQERIIKVDMNIRQGKINVRSAFSVMLSDHNIPIPKVVKDKLASEIKVDVNAALSPR